MPRKKKQTLTKKKTRDKSDILSMLWERPIVVAHSVGFKDMGELHNQWLRSFLYSDKDQTLLAHRESYKTTTVSVFLALHLVLFPNKNIIFFRKTDTNTDEVLRQVVKILKSDIMSYITRALYDIELTIPRQANGHISTNLKTSNTGADQLVGLGINTSITGLHGDVIVTDDIVNKEDRESRAERERTKRAYFELQNVCNRGGRFINTGTPWHEEDTINLFMPNVSKFDCYSTGLMTPEDIEEKRQQMPPSLFAANYELKHIADADAMFDAPQFTHNIADIKGGRAHVDASYGGADFTAYTILKREADGSFVGYGKLYRGHVDNNLQNILNEHMFYKAGSISCEKNADKGYLARDLRRYGIPVNEYTEKENKYIKIATYLKKDWKNIKWIPTTDPNYLRQILNYTENAEHDDAPDSAASLLRMYSRTGKVGNKTSLLYGGG